MLRACPALNTHEEYLRMLARLEKQTAAIEYALVDRKDTRFVKAFAADVVWEKDVNEWWGTKGTRTKLYRVRASTGLFRALRGYETFFRYTVADRLSGRADAWEKTDFGLNDIAFFDAVHHEPLLYTTTHEGYLLVSDALK